MATNIMGKKNQCAELNKGLKSGWGLDKKTFKVVPVNISNYK
jgi:hypothetical protein